VSEILEHYLVRTADLDLAGTASVNHFLLDTAGAFAIKAVLR